MKNRYLLFALIPIVILADLFCITNIGELVSMSSDFAVIAGVTLLCLVAIGNFFVVKFYMKKFKSNPNSKQY